MGNDIDRINNKFIKNSIEYSTYFYFLWRSHDSVRLSL